jgi:hypothetical protein
MKRKLMLLVLALPLLGGCVVYATTAIAAITGMIATDMTMIGATTTAGEHNRG